MRWQIVAAWAVLSLLPVQALAQGERPPAALDTVNANEEVSEAERTSVFDRLGSALGESYRLVDRDRYAAAVDEVFAKLPEEQMTEAGFALAVQETLGIQRLFVPRLLRDDESIQLTVTLFAGEDRRVAEETCDGCSIGLIALQAELLAAELAQEDLGVPMTVQSEYGPLEPGTSVQQFQKEESGLPWWVYVGGAVLVVAAVAASQQKDESAPAEPGTGDLVVSW